MPSRFKRLNDAKTYVILDTQVLGYRALLKLLPLLVKAQTAVVQLRDKSGQAKDMIAFCQRAMKMCQGQTLMIMNDRVDVAVAAKVDGVHLGQDDMPLKMARALVGRTMIVGASCQNLLHARRAQQEGADYIGCGSVFKTLTKPDRSPMNLNLLQNVHSSIKIPIFAIGGITLRNVNSLLNYNVKRVAVCREVLLAKNPGNVVREFDRILLS